MAADSSVRTMPEGYTQLDWVRSNGRQLVRTGIPVTAETVVELSFGNVRYSKDTALFGQGWDAGSFMFVLQNNGYRMYSGNQAVAAYDSTPADVNFTVKAGNGKVTVTAVDGGDSKTSDLSAPLTPAQPELSVFGSSDGAHGGAFTFFAMTIVGANDEPLRDFVPCRNPDGEVGLWDFVSQDFFPNAGTERLFAPDDTDVRLTRIQAARGAYIDTGYTPDQDTRTRMRLTVGGASEVWFGCGSEASSTWWRNNAYALANDGKTIYVGYHLSSTSLTDILPVGWSGVVELDKNVANFYENDAATPTRSETVGAQTFDAIKTMWLFGDNGNLNPQYQFKVNNNVTCYGCRIWDNGTLVRDFLPARRADGAIGMIDVQNGSQFYENRGFATDPTYRMSWGGIAYTLDGTALEVHEGVLAAVDVADFAEVRKVDWYGLDASAVTSYPGALTLAKGLFSLKDGATRSYAVAGALTLGAGARLELDVSGEGCDTITAQSFVLSATAANPVDVRVNAVGVSALDPAAKLEVFPNAAFAAGDAEKFTVSGMPVKFVVENGRLYLVSKDAGEAEWTGAAGDGKWSTARNWLGETVPADGMTVRFNLAAGGATTFDLADRSFKEIVFGENAGAFTIAGSGMIGVTDAIRNESTAAQAISAPCTFGVTGLAFEFACAGELAFGSTASEAPAERLVKTGAGRLVLADTTLWKAANMTVRAGLFTTTYSGLVNGSTPQEGVLAIEDGAMLDVNREFGNSVTSTALLEPYHGKTVVVAGDGDGRGALYNSYMSGNWGSLFGKVVLAGDASMGGSTLTVRAMTTSRIPGAAVEGAYTLTVKDSLLDPLPGKRALVFFSTAFALDRVNVTGWMDVENDPSGLITNGVHLLDGAGLTLYNAKVPADCIPVVAEPGASTLYSSYNSRTASDLTILSGSTLSVDVTKNVTLALNGAVTVNGILDKTLAGGTALLGGTLSGNGTLRGGSIRFDGANARWTMAADDTGFTSKVDVSGVTDAAFLSALKAIDVTYAGTIRQTLDIGPAFGLTGAEAQAISLKVTDGAGLPVDDCWLGVADGRLQLHVRETPVATARWLGGADSALDDPSSWDCRDKDDNVLERELPMETTVVSIPDGSVFNCTNGAPFACKRLNLPASLAADCDLRGVSAELGGTVDLKGRKIYLSTAKGDATFSDGEHVLLESLRAPRGAYIDTGFTPCQDTRTRMRLTVGGAKEVWFGCGSTGANTWWKNNAYALANDGTTIYVGYHLSSVGTGSILPVGWSGVVELNKNVANFYENDAVEPTGSISVGAQTFDAVNTMWLFGDNETQSANYWFKDNNNVTCYGCTIWANAGDAQPVRDYVPAQRVSDDAVGLMDRANGNEFKPSASATAFVAGRVLAAENGGEVHFDIPEGKTETNAGILFRGTVKVVKDGAGTLVAAKTGQAYAGGTDVAAGTFLCGANGSDHIYGSDGSEVTVRDGATFDCDGYSNHDQFHFVLDGGTVKCQADRGRTVSCWFANVTLTKDSFMAGHNFGFVGSNWAESILRMNGRSLTVDVTSGQNFFAGNLKVEGGGEIYMRKGGFLALGGNPGGGKYVMAETTTLRMGGAAISDAGGEHVFGSYVSEYAAGYDTANTVIKVLNRFVPGSQWHATELQDGATLDLSGCTGAWNTACEFPRSGVTALATFAAGSTIYVDLGVRKVKSSEPIVTWSTKPENVNFCATPGTMGRFEARDNGLYRHVGFSIIVR